MGNNRPVSSFCQVLVIPVHLKPDRNRSVGQNIELKESLVVSIINKEIFLFLSNLYCVSARVLVTCPALFVGEVSLRPGRRVQVNFLVLRWSKSHHVNFSFVGTLRSVIKLQESCNTPPRGVEAYVCKPEVLLVAGQIDEKDPFVHVCVEPHVFSLCYCQATPIFVFDSPGTWI